MIKLGAIGKVLGSTKDLFAQVQVRIDAFRDRHAKPPKHQSNYTDNFSGRRDDALILRSPSGARSANHIKVVAR